MDVERLKELWAMDQVEMPAYRIATELGVSRSYLWRMIDRYELPRRERVYQKAPDTTKPIDVPLLYRLWHLDPREISTPEIAKQLGVAPSTIYAIARRHHLPKRERVYDQNEYVPTPEEIAEETRKIRERHFKERRGESEDNTRKRVWHEETQCRQSSSQSRA